jgi:acyl dehydratase
MILHGFGMMTRVIEALVAGDGARLGEIQVRFRKPLVLPAKVGAYVVGDEVFVGEGPGAEAYMSGRFGLR